MNIGGGEAADQVVRMMLSGGEVAVRLTGSAVKNVLALSMALVKDHRKISGKLRMGQMLKETRDLRVFSMTPEQYRAFKRNAKKQKLLYAAIRDKDGKGKRIDVVLPATEIERANMIFERIRYTPGSDAKEQSDRTPTQKKEQREQEVKSKKDSRSEQDSPDISGSSDTPRGADNLEMSDRPSVLKRLKGFREQLDRQRQSAPTQNRQKSNHKQR